MFKKPTPSQIIETRKRLGLSQERFGDRLGVTGRTVRRWERGEVPVPPLMAAVVALFSSADAPAQSDAA